MLMEHIIDAAPISQDGQTKHSPEQLARWLSHHKHSVCRKAEPAFQALWDDGEYDEIEDLLRNVRAKLLEITTGPHIRVKVRAKLHRMMQRITGGKHHGFEHCLRDRQQKGVEWWAPVKKEKPLSDYQTPAYIPTPEQIAEECRRIQAGWSEEERIYRQHAMPGELSGPKRGKLKCQRCGKSFSGDLRRLRCEDCQRQHSRKYYRDRARSRRAGKAVAR